MRIGVTYDLRSDYLALGMSEEDVRIYMRRPWVDARGSIVLSTSRLDFPTPVPML